MDNDDIPRGRIWTRREALAAVGAAGFTLGGLQITSKSTAADAPCIDLVASPDQTEGPFFVDERLFRSDLVSAGADRPSVANGLPFKLIIKVYELSGSTGCPLPGAVVDLWHTDAIGTYSDVAPSGIQGEDTTGQTWLRGTQITDADGQVIFNTIYPGWYVSRTIHFHFKIRLLDAKQQETFDFSSQFYIDDATNDAVLAQAPYNSRGNRNIRNVNDGIYDAALVLSVVDAGMGKEATFAVGIDSATGTSTPTPTLTPTPDGTPTPTPSPTPYDGRPLGDFDDDGCTDLDDFLYMLDSWQIDPGDGVVALPDFLNLLDNWYAGPVCA